MKVFFKNLLIISLFITTIFTFGLFTPVKVAKAESMTVSQLIDLLITIGVIAPDKAVAAREVVANLSKIAPTTVSTPPPYIQVLSPNGKEKWEIDLDLPYSIKWGTSSKVPVIISLVPTKGNVCNLTSSPIVSNNRTNTYSVLLKTAQCFNLKTGTSSPLTDGLYRVRVSYIDEFGKQFQDESDSSFNILPIRIPSIRVSYPNGGESFVRNHDYTIKYSVKNVDSSDYIYIYILDADENIAYNTRQVMKSSRTIDLHFPGSLSSGAYKIKLKATVNREHNEIEDISNNFFWVSSGLE